MMSPGLNPDIGVQVFGQKEMSPDQIGFLKKANLSKLGTLEAWVVKGTNTQINYATHGVYRYFGKFPAPIAAKLIQDYSRPGDAIVDPACGSGTTGVEALLAGRTAHLFDINPLSVLVSKVKSTPIDEDVILSSIERLKARFKKSNVSAFETDEIDLNHWFLSETIVELSNLKDAILGERRKEVRDILLMVFASIIRRVSKATTQQGRLFLDIETAITEVWPIFEKSALKTANRIGGLLPGENVQVACQSLLDDSVNVVQKVPLVIYHPPYFNAYKYTSINSLEMAWLDFPRKVTRKGEIREFFKVGKTENAPTYVDDMVRTLVNARRHIKERGVVAMMIGDALMKGEHVDVTSQIISKVLDSYEVEKIVLRIPKYTEATWATSQRRDSKNLGITMYDFIIILRAK
jgi:site-specific DNA-methyltransferase (cytosine-N4-specific)